MKLLGKLKNWKIVRMLTEEVGASGTIRQMVAGGGGLEPGNQ